MEKDTYRPFYVSLLTRRENRRIIAIDGVKEKVNEKMNVILTSN